MTADEADMWWRYGVKYGLDPITPRNEIVLANIAHLLSVGHHIESNQTHKPFGADHFLPWLKPDEPEGYASKDEIMAMFPRKN